ncbi:hypothetical protein KY284_035956 [Solanum tuberosum]|nr:hypothetical protein KY284_035956 [Solanum tuberosum]
MDDQKLQTHHDSINPGRIRGQRRYLSPAPPMFHHKYTSINFGRFCGDNIEAWIFYAEYYFEFYEIAKKYKLSQAALYLDGEALECRFENVSSGYGDFNVLALDIAYVSQQWNDIINSPLPQWCGEQSEGNNKTNAPKVFDDLCERPTYTNSIDISCQFEVEDPHKEESVERDEEAVIDAKCVDDVEETGKIYNPSKAKEVAVEAPEETQRWKIHEVYIHASTTISEPSICRSFRANVSAITIRSLVQKIEDPSAFIIPCTMGAFEFPKALCDLGRVSI